MRSIKKISIKHRTYYFFNDMINIKNFDSNLLKIDKKSYKYIDVYYICYIIMKSISIGDHANVNSVNLLYQIIGEVDGYLKESNENKYLTFVFVCENEKMY